MAHNLTRCGDAFDGDAEHRIRREKEADKMLAQSQRVCIMPAVKIEKLEMIEGQFGPFAPMAPATVPLYIALLFRHAALCSIEAPEWLCIEYLTRAVEKEEESTEELYEINMYIFDNIEVCLQNCEVLENISEIRMLVKKLEEIRMKKLLKGIEYIDTPIIGINNITFFEYRKIKEYVLPHLEIQKRLQRK